MKKNFLLWSLIFLGSFLGIFPLYAQGPIIITEIMYDLKGDDTDREWIEIKNVSLEEVNLKGWRFNDGSNHLLNEPPQNGGQGSLIIPPSGYAILADKADLFLIDHPGFSGTVIDTVMSLKNTSGTLKLINEKGEVVEEVSYSKEWGGNGNGYSLERVNDFSLEFCQSSILGGTPGMANQPNCSPSPSPSSSPSPSLSLTPTPSLTPSFSPTSFPSPSISPSLSITPFSERKIRIYINEFLPNPSGRDEEGEWIELYNDSPYEVALSGWELKDASGKAYRFQEEKLAPYGYLVLERKKTQISLNNEGETLSLFAPSQVLVFQISYQGKAPEGYAFARFAPKTWYWTKILTPGGPNQFSSENSPKISSEQSKKENLSEISPSPTFVSSFASLTPETHQIVLLVFGLGVILALIAIFIFRRFFV